MAQALVQGTLGGLASVQMGDGDACHERGGRSAKRLEAIAEDDDEVGL